MLIEWYRMSIQLESYVLYCYLYMLYCYTCSHIISYSVCFFKSQHSIAWRIMKEHDKHSMSCKTSHHMHGHVQYIYIYYLYVDTWFAKYMFKITRTIWCVHLWSQNGISLFMNVPNLSTNFGYIQVRLHFHRLQSPSRLKVSKTLDWREVDGCWAPTNCFHCCSFLA